MILLQLKTFCAGLLASCIFSWIHVFHSNTLVDSKIRLLSAAGHAVVPNGPALEALSSPLSALNGAFMFVLTAGVAVTVCAMASWALLYCLVPRNRARSIIHILVWCLVTLGLSIPRFSWLTAAHTLAIPLIVLYFHGCHGNNSKPYPTPTKSEPLPVGAPLKNHPGPDSLIPPDHWHPRVCFSMALGVTLYFFFLLADPGIFLRTRDYLFLSNPLGQTITQWYYTHTPQVAEALKAPMNKQVKSCWIDPDTVAGARIEKILLAHGWLAMPEKSGATLTVEPCDRKRICLNLNSRTLLTVDAGAFLKTPTLFLERYSALGDNMAMFRLLCLAGLVAGFPLVLFGIVFVLVEILFSVIFPKKVSNIAAAILVTLFFMGILIYVTPREIRSDHAAIQQGLMGSDPRTRINALRTVVKTGAEIFDFVPFHGKKRLLSDQTNIAERYWTANALKISSQGSATGFLEQMTADQSINVQCAAIKALATMGCKKSSAVIFKYKMKNSPHWYVQQAAYGAFCRCRFFYK